MLIPTGGWEGFFVGILLDNRRGSGIIGCTNCVNTVVKNLWKKWEHFRARERLYIYG